MVRQSLQRQILDRPVEISYRPGAEHGLFLSGGLDSLALLHWLSISLPELTSNLTLFTIEKEPVHYAQRIAAHYNIEKHIVVPKGDEGKAAKKVLTEFSNIEFFYAAVTALPAVSLTFSGPIAVRNDRSSERMQLPFYALDKRYTVQLAFDLNAPIELAHSCTTSTELHCGECFMCAERKWAFLQLQKPDVVTFEN